MITDALVDDRLGWCSQSGSQNPTVEDDRNVANTGLVGCGFPGCKAPRRRSAPRRPNGSSIVKSWRTRDLTPGRKCQAGAPGGEKWNGSGGNHQHTDIRPRVA
jgi:hypothetical protein